MSDESALLSEIDFLVNGLSPTAASNLHRKEISSFVANLFTCMEGITVDVGSTALRAYLPEGDIDLVLFNGRLDLSNQELIFHVFKCLFQAVSSEFRSNFTKPMVIRNIEFINARTNVVHCLVNNTNVDITVDQLGAVSSVLFLEESSRIVGNNHLFKKSLLLIKSWCINESVRFCGQPIAGSKHGMLSSYALSVMILFLFNSFPDEFHHPFQVFRRFLHVFCTFDWDNFAVTLDGPVELPALTSSSSSVGASRFACENRFQGVADQLTAQQESWNELRHAANSLDNDSSHVVGDKNASNIPNSNSSNMSCKTFVVKCCNIVDPMDRYNNLGISVSRMNLLVIGSALTNAHRHLEQVLMMLASPRAPTKPPRHEERPPTNVVAACVTDVTTVSAALQDGSTPPNSVSQRNEQTIQVQQHHLSRSASPSFGGIPRPRSHSAIAALAAPPMAVNGSVSGQRDHFGFQRLRDRSGCFLGVPIPLSHPQYVPADSLPTAAVSFDDRTVRSHSPQQPQSSQSMKKSVHNNSNTNTASSRAICSVQPSDNQEDCYFLRLLFPVSMSMYLAKDVLRADLRDHPLQLTNGLFTPNSEQRQDGDKDVVGSVPLDCDLMELKRGLQGGLNVLKKCFLGKKLQGNAIESDQPRSDTFPSTQVFIDQQIGVELSNPTLHKAIAEAMDAEPIAVKEEKYDHAGNASSIFSAQEDVTTERLPLPKSSPLESRQEFKLPTSLNNFGKPNVAESEEIVKETPTFVKSEGSDAKPLGISSPDISKCPRPLPAKLDSKIEISSLESNSTRFPKNVEMKGFWNRLKSIIFSSGRMSSEQPPLPLSTDSSEVGHFDFAETSSDISYTTSEGTGSSQCSVDLEERGGRGRLESLQLKKMKRRNKEKRISLTNESTGVNLASDNRRTVPAKSGWIPQSKIVSQKPTISKTTTCSRPKTYRAAMVLLLRNTLNKYFESYGAVGMAVMVTSLMILLGGGLCSVYSEEIAKACSIVVRLMEKERPTSVNVSGSSPILLVSSPALFPTPVAQHPPNRTFLRTSEAISVVPHHEEAVNISSSAKESCFNQWLDSNPSQELSQSSPSTENVTNCNVASTINVTVNVNDTDKVESIDLIRTSDSIRETSSITAAAPVHWVNEGSAITIGVLSTDASDSKNKTYQWFRNGVNITDTTFPDPFYTLSSMAPELAGLYTCMETQNDVSQRDNLEDIVRTEIRLSEPPFCGTKSTYYMLAAGEPLVIHLSPLGAPPPSARWFRNGIPLNGFTKSTLRVEDVTPADSGTYTCEFTNIAGVYRWAEATIIIQ